MWMAANKAWHVLMKLLDLLLLLLLVLMKLFDLLLLILVLMKLLGLLYWIDELNANLLSGLLLLLLLYQLYHTTLLFFLLYLVFIDIEFFLSILMNCFTVFLQWTDIHIDLSTFRMRTLIFFPCLIVFMNFFVLFQISSCSEFLFAFITWIWSNSCMNQLMSL